MCIMFPHFTCICTRGRFLHFSTDGQLCRQLLTIDYCIFWMHCRRLCLWHQTVFIDFQIHRRKGIRQMFYMVFFSHQLLVLLTISKWWLAHGPHSIGWFAGNIYRQLQWSQYWWPHLWNCPRREVIIRHGLQQKVLPNWESGHIGALS